MFDVLGQPTGEKMELLKKSEILLNWFICSFNYSRFSAVFVNFLANTHLFTHRTGK